MIRKKIRNFRTFSSRKHPIKSTFRKKSIEKLILINFQPFQKQIKVLTKFHNFKPPEMNIFFSAAGGLPQVLPQAGGNQSGDGFSMGWSPCLQGHHWDFVAIIASRRDLGKFVLVLGDAVQATVFWRVDFDFTSLRF